MRPRHLIAGAVVLVSLAACSKPDRDQEQVTVPGEGPTYLNDSTAVPAASAPRDTQTRIATPADTGVTPRPP